VGWQSLRYKFDKSSVALLAWCYINEIQGILITEISWKIFKKIEKKNKNLGLVFTWRLSCSIIKYSNYNDNKLSKKIRIRNIINFLIKKATRNLTNAFIFDFSLKFMLEWIFESTKPCWTYFLSEIFNSYLKKKCFQEKFPPKKPLTN
jgi:hypothetical protein